MEKLLPQNIDAEMSVLGSIIIDPEAVFSVQDFLRSDDFYRDAHRSIYTAILTLVARNEPADLLTLSDELEADGKLEKVGGSGYIISLINGVPTSGNVEYYGRIVERLAIQRRLIHASGEIAAHAYNQDSDSIEFAQSLIFNITDRKSSNMASTLAEIAGPYMDELSDMEDKPQLTGIPTGFKVLDYLLGGLQPGDLIVPAGRPAMGKSAFILCLAYNAAFHSDKRVLICSLEMSKKQLFNRLVSMRAGVDSQRLRINRLTPDERERAYQAIADLATSNIIIDDTQELTTDMLRAKVRRYKAEKQIDMVIVDHLQLMQAHIDGKRIPEKRIEIGEISQSLKSIALDCNIPVIAPSQLSRECEKRADKIPQLSDLNESGKIEQDADIVLFLFRKEYYFPGERPGEADIIIAKHRNGPVGEIALHYHASTTLFTDLEV